MSEHKAIFKSAGVLSAFTILSRITGFFRDVLIANVFGTGMAAQAFFVAFKIPNMLRDVMGEGAGNAAFVPVFCEYISRKTREDFLKLVNSLFILLLAVSAAVVCAGVVFASPLVRLIAPGFSVDPAKFKLTVDLTRILFPYLLLVTVSAYLMSVANSLRSFAVSGSASTVFNLFMIAAIFPIANIEGVGAIYALSVAVLLAGVAQAAVQVPSLLRLGVDFRKGGCYEHPLKNEAIRKIGRLISPRIVGTSIYQLNIFVDTIFASLSFFVGEGAIAAVYYANRIIQFPFSVFGVAISNAALPAMSAHSAGKDMDKFRMTLDFCFKAAFLCIIPLTAGILIFSAPIVRAVFERGRFDAYSTAITSKAVFFYGLGLIGYVGVRFFSLGFYALQDTVTPVKSSGIALVMNVLMNSFFIFVLRLGLSGLALASSISATANFIILYRSMKSKAGYSFSPDLKRLVSKALSASVVMGAAAWSLWRIAFGASATLAILCCVAFFGAMVYFFILWRWDVNEIRELVNWLKRKR
ncbi:MAG TPA: murein biosynthesis integral membrane protein MurJ [Candidatus Omnitrophica bacterium]|nr:murein biosynthesis integral membrane protein MurJ [Candidatus Omnitrophota bacterium]